MEDAEIVANSEPLSNEDHVNDEIHEVVDDLLNGNDEIDALEKEASDAGWRKDGRLNAAEYLEHKEVLSSRSRNARLIEENLAIKKQLEENTERLAKQEKAAEEYREFQDQSHKRELERLKTEATAQIQDLKQQRAEAIRNGDGDAVNDIDDRIDALKESTRAVEVKPESVVPVVEVKSAPKPADKPAGNHPEFDGWLAENEWFKVDKELQDTAEAMAIVLKRGGDTSEGKVFFDKVKERVRKLHPDKFENPNRKRPGTVETHTGSPSYKGKSVDDLPDVAKAQMKDFIKSGIYAKESKAKGVSAESLYLKEYFS
jgi:DNA primase